VSSVEKIVTRNEINQFLFVSHAVDVPAYVLLRLLIKILTWLILQLSKEAITALIQFIVGLRKLWSISSWAP